MKPDPSFPKTSGEYKPLSEIELGNFIKIAQHLVISGSAMRLIAEREMLMNEVSRLKRGDFTPEEFQNLCHNLHERPVCTREEFAQGCLQFQEKLFGKIQD